MAVKNIVWTEEESMKLRYHLPLIGFLVPTLVISTLMFIYRERPPMDQLIGFYVCVIGATITYYVGIHTVLKDKA
ncbi:MAG TPA: hypothetical protein PLR71_01035 [Deltaproteobacteria bacterium]|nr:hypothetical protein [Deltaproteobacteria bacterium]HQI80116.1 hypothetical protein [Deltaproteobacteria bacterium]